MSNRFRIVPNTLAQRLANELVLVHPATDQIFLLNSTAARVWELMCEQHDVDEIEAKLTHEFEGDSVQISRDIDLAIDRFLQEGFIELIEL